MVRLTLTWRTHREVVVVDDAAPCVRRHKHDVLSSELGETHKKTRTLPPAGAPGDSSPIAVDEATMFGDGGEHISSFRGSSGHGQAPVCGSWCGLRRTVYTVAPRISSDRRTPHLNESVRHSNRPSRGRLCVTQRSSGPPSAHHR